MSYLSCLQALALSYVISIVTRQIYSDTSEL